MLELPCGGFEGGRCSMLALHLRGTAFLWHQVSLGASAPKHQCLDLKFRRI